MRNIKLGHVSSQLEGLSEDERRALRGSKFAPLPAGTVEVSTQPRIPHPGGPVATNKAAALAKFLQRKLETSGSVSLNPTLVEAAVENAKASLHGTTNVRHVDAFSDSDKEADMEIAPGTDDKPMHDIGKKKKGQKKNKKKRKWKQAAKAVDMTRKQSLKKQKKH
ncbi:hypothetical protein KP509_19G012900 [Ceratopteris richardii]|uniref:Uncharacterized protein n=1 Tax=Ceratopteris richardii TaxID=49495 RepID=A0A8T2SL61_CERRI|nr:hypothetical protein KP509_19G012900 [Ceratopteris richardii]